MGSDLKLLGLLLFVGVFVGVGQLLASNERITIRLALGRAIVSGGLGLAAGTALAFLPSLSLPALVGIAAVLTSLGTSAIERLFQRFIGQKT